MRPRNGRRLATKSGMIGSNGFDSQRHPALTDSATRFPTGNGSDCMFRLLAEMLRATVAVRVSPVKRKGGSSYNVKLKILTEDIVGRFSACLGVHLRLLLV